MGNITASTTKCRAEIYGTLWGSKADSRDYCIDRRCCRHIFCCTVCGRNTRDDCSPDTTDECPFGSYFVCNKYNQHVCCFIYRGMWVCRCSVAGSAKFFRKLFRCDFSICRWVRRRIFRCYLWGTSSSWHWYFCGAAETKIHGRTYWYIIHGKWQNEQRERQVQWEDGCYTGKGKQCDRKDKKPFRYWFSYTKNQTATYQDWWKL